MKIAILSDLHLGYAFGTEREEDSFVQAEEALKKAAQADLILIAGDIFDSRNPKQEVLKEALRLFSELKENVKDKAKLIEIRSLENISLHETHKLGIPIVAIAGTHERRAKAFVNPVKLLEEAGYLIQLDGQAAIFEKGKEQVSIFGISGVPEIYIREKLKELNPKPILGATNILMMHQSLKDYVYMDEDKPTLTLDDLPKGFDLIVNGHIHWSDKTKISNTDLLITGSTITTQIRKSEFNTPKKIFIYDSRSKKIDEQVLSSCREVFYFDYDISQLKNVKEIINKKLSELSKRSFEKKPLVRIKLLGEASETTDLSQIEEEFKDKLILSIKDDSQSKEEGIKLSKAQELLGSTLSIDELGLRMLEERAKEAKLSFSIGEIFELLSAGELETAEELLTKPKEIKIEEATVIETISYIPVGKGQQRLL